MLIVDLLYKSSFRWIKYYDIAFLSTCIDQVALMGETSEFSINVIFLMFKK
jgi:hypothetical protein